MYYLGERGERVLGWGGRGVVGWERGCGRGCGCEGMGVVGWEGGCGDGLGGGLWGGNYILCLKL